MVVGDNVAHLIDQVRLSPQFGEDVAGNRGAFFFLIFGLCALIFPLRLVDPDVMEVGRGQDHCRISFFFTDDLVRTWIDYKRDNEIDPLRLRPHPHEFSLYYDN
jgi:hypothetical protein